MSRPRPMSGLVEELSRVAGRRTLAEIGEKRLLEEFLLPLCRTTSATRGIGDDAAVLSLPAGCEVVVSSDRVPTDLLARGFGLMSPEDFGRYVARVNVSDLVAMGATPRALVVAAAFPADTTVVYVLELMGGLYDESARLGAPVAGGDTKAASEESISACAIGAVAAGTALFRGPVSPGDRVYVTGTVGRAGAGVRWFGMPERSRAALRRDGAVPPEVEARLKDAIVAPRPRRDLLPGLQAHGRIRGCMDITDGLGQTLAEIAQSSGVQISISADLVPVDHAATAVLRIMDVDPKEAIAGLGIDLELVLVVPPGETEPPDATFIGVVDDGEGVYLDQNGAKEPLLPRGYEHFSRSPRAHLH